MSRWPNWRQKQVMFAHVGYTPNAAQVPFHRATAEVVQLVGAEGAGKSLVTAMEIVANVPWCDLIYLAGQTYSNTHSEFAYLIEALVGHGLARLAEVATPQNASWRLKTVTGCRIVTLSMEKGVSALIALGEQPDLIVLPEGGVIKSYSVFTASVRRVTRTRGRVLVSGTLRDDFGWYASLVDDLTPKANLWRGETFSLPAWSNPTLYPGGEQDPEIQRLKAILPADEFARTVAAKRVPSRAAIFPEFSYALHVKPCPFEPALPVWLAVDPGYYPSAYAVLVLQPHGREVWQVDELYLHQHTDEQVIEECQKRPWWRNVLRDRDVVMDFAAKQHHAARSSEEVWAKAVGALPRSQFVPIMDGIKRHKTFLQQQRLIHDEERCPQTLREYKLYRRPTDDDGNPTADEPRDLENHSMKALAYILVDKFGVVDRIPRPQAAPAVDPYGHLG